MNTPERSVSEIMNKYVGLQEFPLTVNPDCSVSVYDAIKEDLQAERQKREEVERRVVEKIIHSSEVCKECLKPIHIHPHDFYDNKLDCNCTQKHYD